MGDIKGFFAYPSHPIDLNETIDGAIELLNKNSGLHIKSWKHTGTTGHFIINEILREIETSDIFLCDLTYLNFNVLFELGFAIAKNKPVWIVFNGTIVTAKRDLDRLQLLSTIGYSNYQNRHQIVDSFLTAITEDTPRSLLSDIQAVQSNQRNLLYLKSPVNSDASMQLSIAIKESILPTVIDDPAEVNKQPFEWYLRHLRNSFGIVVHFLSDQQQDSDTLNAKNSIISGLAVGSNVPTLMLAHAPFASPIDYRDMLMVHSTANECLTYSRQWLDSIEREYRENQQTYQAHKHDQRALGELQSLFVGEPIAENESEQLTEYFVETSQYLEALNAQQTLFVGRKGTGKTANLVKIADELAQDKRNFICIIQPVGHEIEGVLNMLKQSIARSEQSYLVESIWKYLIYTELAKATYRTLVNRPAYIQFTVEEDALIGFVQQHEKLINADFTLRLENAVSMLCGLSEYKSVESQRIKISEILHENIIVQLRTKLGDVLHSKNRVCILIDNLDAAWNQTDLNEMSEFLFGLLGISKRITDEFRGADYQNRAVNLSLIVFLRSDIFSQILLFAKERDKIPHSKLIWDDNELLFRVVESRFSYSAETVPSPKDLWERFFCEKVRSIPLKDYVSQLILPRPRDIIFLFRAAVQEAVNRGHTKVSETDILSAESKYSQYALDSILAENGNRVNDLEALLYEFAGAPEIISIEEVNQNLKRFNIANNAYVIDVLCELTFLGLETSPDEFQFMDENRNKRILYRLAERTVQASDSKVQRFRIHNAFHAYLDITKV